MSARYQGNHFDPSYRKPRERDGGGGRNGYGGGENGGGGRPDRARDTVHGGYPPRNDPPPNYAGPQHVSRMNHYTRRPEYPPDPRQDSGPPRGEYGQPGIGIPAGPGHRTAAGPGHRTAAQGNGSGSGSGSGYGYVPDRPGGGYPPQSGDRGRGSYAGDTVQSGYNARSVSPANLPVNPSGYRNRYDQRPADFQTGPRPNDSTRDQDRSMAEIRNNSTYSQAVPAPAPSAPRYDREPPTQPMSAPADRTRHRLPEETRPRSISGTSGDPRFTRNGQNVMVAPAPIMDGDARFSSGPSGDPRFTRNGQNVMVAPAPVTNGEARFKRKEQNVVVASVPNTPQRPAADNAPLSAPPKSHTHTSASPVSMVHSSRMGMVPISPVNNAHPGHREQEGRRKPEASYASTARHDERSRSGASVTHGGPPRPNFISHQQALDESMHEGQSSLTRGKQMLPPSLSPSTDKNSMQSSTPKQETASNDPSELSSLAKLRQFKASIAASRNKRPADVDSGRLAEMATTFLASEFAVPPTPTTQQASQMAQTPEVQTPVSALERPVAEVLNHPSLPRRPTEVGAPDNSVQSTPSKSVTTAPPASDAVRAKTREQELKERLLSLKKDSQSPTTAIARGVPHRSGKESQVQETKDGNKRERPEEGEITEEETTKRHKSDIDVPPQSAGNAATEPGSAGRRLRAEEWMKTTTTPEAPSVPSGERKTRRGSRGGRGDEDKTRSPEISRRASSGNQDRRYSTSSRPGAESRHSGGGFNDPSYRKNRQAEEVKRRERSEVIEHRPSLADRISEQAPDNRHRGRSADRRISMSSQPRPQHPERHDMRRQSGRSSRSPQRPAQRPLDDRPNYDRNQQANMALSRDMLRGNSSHSRTGGSEHHGPTGSPYGGYDDRRPYNTAVGGHQPPPPPLAPTIPTNEVVETLALLKAQIQRLEAQLPGALAAPPTLPPPPQPERSTASYNAPATQTRAVSVTGDPRFTRRVEYDRPPSPQRPPPVPRSGHDNRQSVPAPGPGYDYRQPYSDNYQQSAYPRSDERRGYDNDRSGYDQRQQQDQDPYMDRDRQHRDSVSTAYDSRPAPPPPTAPALQSYSYDSRQTGPPAGSGGYRGDYPTERGGGRYDPPPPPPPSAPPGRYDYDQPPHRNDPGPPRPHVPQSGGGRPRGRGGHDNAQSRDNGRSKNSSANHSGRGGGGGDRGKGGRGGRGGARGSGSGRRGRGRGRGN